jgi:hypothetical protein
MKYQVTRSLSVLGSILLLLWLTGCGSSGESVSSGIVLTAGETISFADNIAGGAENGWSVGPESGGTWTASDRAILKFSFGKEFDAGMAMSLDLISFVNEKNPRIDLNLKANDVQVGSFNFNQSNSGGVVEIKIDSKTLAMNPGVLTLEFNIPNSTSPKALGISEDIRDLGIFLMKIIPSNI